MKMKKYILLCAALCVMMVTAPLLSVNYAQRTVTAPPTTTAATADSGTIRVMRSETGFIAGLDVREYLIGCVAGEMPATYHKEALKAQATVCYTYAKYVSARDGGNLGGADISDDSKAYQSYLDETERKSRWKTDYKKNEAIIEAAVDDVLYEYLAYEGKPIMAVYFDCCSGRTESCAHIWGGDVPYLVSVPSDGDRLNPALQTTVTVSPAALQKAFRKQDVRFPADKADWITQLARYESGVVRTVKVGDKTISGTAFRSALSLKSADFEVSYTEKDGFRITCSGSGHFVGMSQYGADYMARQGSSCHEILAHYYPAAEPVSLSD